MHFDRVSDAHRLNKSIGLSLERECPSEQERTAAEFARKNEMLQNKLARTRARKAREFARGGGSPGNNLKKKALFNQT